MYKQSECVFDEECDMVVWAEPRAMKVDHIRTVTHEQTEFQTFVMHQFSFTYLQGECGLLLSSILNNALSLLNNI